MQIPRFARDDKSGMVGEWRELPFDHAFPQNTAVNWALGWLVW